MNNLFKNLAIWLVIGVVLMTVFNQFNTRQTPQASMEYSQFMEEVTHGNITKVVIEGRVLKATTSDGRKLTTYAPPDLWMVSDLLKHGVKVEAKPEPKPEPAPAPAPAPTPAPACPACVCSNKGRAWRWKSVKPCPDSHHDPARL